MSVSILSIDLFRPLRLSRDLCTWLSQTTQLKQQQQQKEGNAYSTKRNLESSGFRKVCPVKD